jgi:hypothetical protein
MYLHLQLIVNKCTIIDTTDHDMVRQLKLII